MPPFARFSRSPVVCAVGPVPTSSNRIDEVARVAAKRPLWYPGATAPSHLNGTLHGDYGFDPLHLGKDRATLKWYREAELMNGRWAMAAVPTVLALDASGCQHFWEIYKQVSIPACVAVFLLIGVLENQRLKGYEKTGECGFLSMHPFDPLNMGSEEMRLVELKHGRLAMCAFLGFCSQGAVTGMGPIECLQSHFENPYINNIYTSSEGEETALGILCLVFWPFIYEAQKALAIQDPNTNSERTSETNRQSDTIR